MLYAIILAMRIAIVQSAPAFGQVEANLEALRASIGDHEADFYVLPELALSGYDFLDREEAASFAEPPDGRLVSALAREATSRGAGIVFGFAEEFRGLRVGLAICFDWIFPESFRTLALMGADLVAHSANLVLPYCQRVDFARAVENRVYVATANRVGDEDRTGRKLAFTGGSVLVAPSGTSG
jgi:predicted amidohydrolase